MKQLLINWMNSGRSYIVGSILYDKFGHDESVKKLLKTGKSQYTEKALLSAIQSMLKDDSPKKESPIEITSGMEKMPESDDNVLQALRKEWMPAYTEMNYKRHQLDQYLEDETDKAVMQRSALAKSILELEQYCMSVWAKREHYIKYSSLPGTSIEKEVISDPFAAANRISNVKVYIRRYRSELKKNPGNAKAAEMLNHYQQELKQLNQQHG